MSVEFGLESEDGEKFSDFTVSNCFVDVKKGEIFLTGLDGVVVMMIDLLDVEVDVNVEKQELFGLNLER